MRNPFWGKSFTACVCPCVCLWGKTFTACVGVSSRGGVGGSSKAKTQSSLGRLKPQPPPPFPSVNNPALFIPRQVSFPLPCNKSKQLSKDNAGTMVLLILQQRREADNTGIYLTRWLSEASYSLMN